jgi:hypothetical protein
MGHTEPEREYIFYCIWASCCINASFVHIYFRFKCNLRISSHPSSSLHISAICDHHHVLSILLKLLNCMWKSHIACNTVFPNWNELSLELKLINNLMLFPLWLSFDHSFNQYLHETISRCWIYSRCPQFAYITALIITLQHHPYELHK